MLRVRVTVDGRKSKPIYVEDGKRLHFSQESHSSDVDFVYNKHLKLWQVRTQFSFGRYSGIYVGPDYLEVVFYPTEGVKVEAEYVEQPST